MKEVLIPGTMTCYGPDFVAHVVPDHEHDELMYQHTKFNMAMHGLDYIKEQRDAADQQLRECCDIPSYARTLRLAYAIFNAEIAKRLRTGDTT